MREILFRGKLRDGNWCYGFYLKATNHWNKNGIHEDWIVESVIQNGGYLNVCGRRAVIAETVGQFTGLNDKNGKKIFEGDVIQFHKFRDEPDWVGIISYDQCQYVVTGKMPLAYKKPMDGEAFHCPFEVTVSGIDKATIKVIGNIHDNPELLEVAP